LNRKIQTQRQEKSASRCLGQGRSGGRRSNAAQSTGGKARHRIFQKYQGRHVSRDAVIATSKLDCPNRTIVGLTRRSVRRLLGCFFRQDREILRSLTILDFTEALSSDAALEQLAYGGCPARHSPCKSPSVNDPQFLVREHDLKPLASVEFTHVPLREPTLRAVLRRHINAKSPK